MENSSHQMHIQNLHYLSTKEIESVFSSKYSHTESERCLGCNNYCLHCQDYAAINSDIAIGDDGSQDEYKTLIAWTDSGKELVENFIKTENLSIGSISRDILDEKIKAKLKRKIIDHPKSIREMILSNILKKGSSTISKLKDDLGLEMKDFEISSNEKIINGGW